MPKEIDLKTSIQKMTLNEINDVVWEVCIDDICYKVSADTAAKLHMQVIIGKDLWEGLSQ